MFKKYAALLAVLLSVVLLAACGKTAEKKDYADKAFYTSLEKGLHNRWVLNRKQQKAKKTDDSSDIQRYLDTELKQVNKYKGKDFKSKKLHKLAVSYIAVLKYQKKILPDFDNESEKSQVSWANGSIKRAEVLSQIGEYKKLKFKSAKDRDEFKNVTVTALNYYRDYVKTVHDTNAMVKAAKFNLTSNDGGYKTYDAVIQNTTKHDFTYFNLGVKLIDKNGVTVDTQTPTTDNWSHGSKVQFEFNTDKDFTTYKLTADDYDYDN